MSEEIIMTLQGGLGNQLFQYAAGLALQAALGGTLWLTPQEENSHSTRDYRIGLMRRGKAIGRDGSPQAPGPVKAWLPQDPFEEWTPSIFYDSKALFTKGYYQYLPAIQEQVAIIREDLLARLAPVRQGIAAHHRIHSPQQTAFLHVRREDYLTLDPTTFWVQGPEYYTEAIAAVQSRMTTPLRWLVLSDDPPWCREQPWLPSGAEILDEPDEIIGLLLMSLCEGGAILANSTYSWWGAVLAGGAGSATPVVYPRRWVGPYQPHLFPADWIPAGPSPYSVQSR